jgi:ComF family protein
MPYSETVASARGGTAAARALFFLREYFFPSGCALCGAALLGAGEAWYGLCETCRAGIAAEWAADRGGTRERCDRCGRPLISCQGRCLSCRNGEQPACDRVITLFPYMGTYRRLLRSYKFDRTIALGHLFAGHIGETLDTLMREAAAAGGPLPSLVPVPPRPGKIRRSGWDQVEYLARLLEKERVMPVSRCLKRLRSKTQKELGRAERETNLRGRIVLTEPPPRSAVLIDDVMTTGSTINVCAGVLKAGGAERVYGLCLFYN